MTFFLRTQLCTLHSPISPADLESDKTRLPFSASLSGSPAMSGHHFVKPEPGYPVGQNGGMDLASIPLAPASHVNIKPDPEADSPSAASSSRPQQKPPPEKSFLEQLVDETAPENLENGVRIGVQLLDSLKEPLEAALGAEDTQAGQWLKAIRDLQDEAKPTRTIVGVV